MKKILVETKARSQFVDITTQVRAAVNELKIQNGSVLVYVPHTTAGVTINEHADPDVARDLVNYFERLVPWDDPDYRHNEGNTAAHIKASLMGSSARILLSNGKLQLGTWQGVFLCEFDGPRQREVWVDGE